MPNETLGLNEIEILRRSNPGNATQSRIFLALQREKEAGRSPAESWEETKKILTGKKVAYEGNPDLDDTAEAPYSLNFRKGDTALDTVIAGIAYQQLEYAELGHADKERLRADNKYGMAIKSIGPNWSQKPPVEDEIQMSPSSANYLQSLLPVDGKMQLGVRSRSAGHTENSHYSRT